MVSNRYNRTVYIDSGICKLGFTFARLKKSINLSLFKSLFHTLLQASQASVKHEKTSPGKLLYQNIVNTNGSKSELAPQIANKINSKQNYVPTSGSISLRGESQHHILFCDVIFPVEDHASLSEAIDSLIRHCHCQ